MRKIEYLREGVPALFREVQKEPIKLSYRGINEDKEDLYEIKRLSGEIIFGQATLKDIFEGLAAAKESK